jgi:CheY-like chemotaxis protein
MKASTQIATWMLALGLSTAASGAHACGEAMYRMGGALRYHAFITRHPAEILLYSGPAQLQHSDEERARFHENLERAGHKVTVVTDSSALAQALATHSYDVIIASTGDMEVVTANIVATSREPTLIPVLRHNASDEEEMRARFPKLVKDDANLNQFLKVIEQSMKARGT